MAYRWSEKHQAWEISVERPIDPLTKRRRRKTRRLHEPHTASGEKLAKLEEAKMLVEVDDEDVADSSAKFAAAAEAWFARGVASEWTSPRTRDEYRRLLDKRVLPRWGTVELREIKRADIRAWHDQLVGDDLSLASVRRIHAVLRAVLQFAVARDWLAKNPASERREDRLLKTERRAILDVPTADQVNAVIDEIASDTMRDMVRLMGRTGMRPGEICALQWRDVDEDRGELLVRRSIAEHKDGSNRLEVKEPKNNRQRQIKLADLGEIFERWRTDEVGGRWFIWAASPDGSVPFRPSSMTEAWRLARRKAGMEWRLYDLRHHAATQMLAAGIPVLTVQKVLGHQTATMTLDRYGHAIPSQDDEAIAVLAKLVR